MADDIKPKGKNQEADSLKESPKKSRALPKKAQADNPPKPLVEGINAPKSTNDVIVVNKVKPSFLTEQEKQLISQTGEQNSPQEPRPEPKLLPQSVINRVNNNQQSSGWGRLIWLAVFLLLAFSGYELYKEYVAGHTGGDNQGQAVVYDYQPEATQPLATSTQDLATTTSVENLSNVASSTPATTTPPVVELKLKINPTSTGWLNFREGPSLSNKIITRVYPGEVYSYINQQSGWYKITLPDGRSGWVYGQYVTPQ